MTKGLSPDTEPLDRLTLRGAPDAPALVDKAGVLDFAGLEEAVGAVASWLRAQGLAPGDRVASWLAKTRLACVMPLAAVRAELIHVPVNPLLKHAQVSHILKDSGAKMLIAGAGRLGTLQDGDRPEVCAAVLETDVPMTGEGLPPSPADGDTSKLAAILYTSGSTGRPKGVMLSHANLWLGAVSVATYLKVAPQDRILAVMPLSFDYGQNQLLSSWYAGASVVPLDYLTPRDVVKAVERFAANSLPGVPPLWVQLLEAEWPPETAARLKRLTNTGGALTPRLVRGLRGMFPQADLYAMYGLTEAFRSAYLDPSLIDEHPDSVGSAVPFAEVMIVRSDGTRAGPDEPGELVHAGPLVAQGYWQDEERTAQRFKPAPAFSEYGGMAVWSGDTAMVGADGLLRFVGRDDEMIKSAGNRISPTEIEDAVLAGGEVAECAVFGVPDPRLGQAIVVIARPKGDPDAAEASVRERLRRELPSFQQPQRYRWQAELPRNPNGKLDRTALRLSLMETNPAEARV
ncbi:acyl-CoA ligase (AMP-forming), exosortase A system-associated [Stakelama tenebrarum]|uniref:Acyl-CoA ligase (AMP-forming), exosortase A system-associated n=1 Tax=Stakelama tenebrarum TaxID=2711215 RepID=A0A6G6Y6X8_9SPHN|nr:acyl-CoA ligase (AMP-forming), exosortase A system-associated [Sphingosinithalassobacter tenebrarum]QIG80692.1 acyl-CoA ligase (AMP-forming), exosortase A system-associated [Sphingosinithalassobacter tenebrarum]